MKVLYIVYWGASEPLGQSLVLPAVKKLAELGADLTLVTFEKPADLQQADEMSRIRESLSDKQIYWIPLRYHKHPKMPATAFDFLNGYVRSVLARLRARPDVVHARTFVGGLMGLAIASTLNSKFIYHNEGFYPDEQVDAGVWKQESAAHRFAKFLERSLYSRAAGIIALSQKAKAIIEGFPSAVAANRTPVIVVPSCVDLDRFRWEPKPHSPSEILRLIYVGSVGGRYDLERVTRFAHAASLDGPVHLRVLTQSDRHLVKSILKKSGLQEGFWSIDRVPYQKIPGELSSQSAGVHFLAQGISDHGGSPTKIGEYWAAGLPAVVTPNAGDSDEIIRRERVGVIVEGNSDERYRHASRELRSLLKDRDLAFRCHRAAENHYSLGAACERQLNLYEQLSLRAIDNAMSVSASEPGKL